MDSVLILAGDNSGEKYGSDLVRHFNEINPSFSFFGVGGKNMADQGIKLLFQTEDLAVVGVFEIISHLPRIKKIFNRIINESKRQKPLAAVLIDSPDFNLRLAKKLKGLSIPILYYISPTVWAWRKKRLKTIKKTVTKMMLIFPFEEEVYKKYGIPAVYVGHPLTDKVRASLSKEEFIEKYGLDSKKKIITLQPGSRKSEVKYHLPVLLESLALIKSEWNTQFLLLQAENFEKDFFIKQIPSLYKDIKVLKKDHYEALSASEVALSACGTANLEAALLETPLVSFYRISPLTYFFGARFVNIKNYSIVNILANKRVVPELIQKKFSAENIFREAKRILESEETRAVMKSHFLEIKTNLGKKIASHNAAQELANLIQSNKT